jgi:hypothetical protein
MMHRGRSFDEARLGLRRLTTQDFAATLDQAA